MGVLVLVLVVVIIAGLVVIYLRLSPLQPLLDERTALFGAQESRSQVEKTQGAVLLEELRTLHKEQTALQLHERTIAAKLQGCLAEERTASTAFCAQLNAGRQAFEGLCAQLNAERLASQALRDQLDEERAASEGLREELEVERIALLELLFSESAPELVERGTQALEQRRALLAAHAKWSRPRGEALAALRRNDETKRHGRPLPPAALVDQHADHTEQARDQEQNPNTRTEEEPPAGEQMTGLPTTPEALAAQSELVAATAADDEDADDVEPTRHWSSADVAAALTAKAGDENAEGMDPTRHWTSAELGAALEADAGGATRLPQIAPSALPSGPVAPPASASSPLSDVPAMKAAGLWPPQSEHVAPPAPPRRTVTEMGMPALQRHAPTRGPLTQRGSSLPTPAGSAPRPIPHAAKTLLSMPAQGAAPTSSPSASEAPPPDRTGPRDTHESLPLFFTVAPEAGK